MTWAVSAFIVVDLPAPFGPSRPTHLPIGTSRSRPSTAVIGPNRLTSPRSRIAESIGPRLCGFGVRDLGGQLAVLGAFLLANRLVRLQHRQCDHDCREHERRPDPEADVVPARKG